VEQDLSPLCAECGRPATTVRLVPESAGVRFSYTGICAGNGGGDLVSPVRESAIRTAFSPPYSTERIKLADLYDDGGYCTECGKFYCFSHWRVSTTGGGRCPQGHFKSLDPHWSPDE
jgi:hypothetical protein